MLYKIKNKPFWYQLWAISVAMAAIYYLIIYFFFTPTSFDKFIEVYALFSLLIDYIFFPNASKK
jgi:hypothetical protein